MKLPWKLSVLVVLHLSFLEISNLTEALIHKITEGKDKGLQGGGIVAGSIMSAFPQPYCSLIYIADDKEPAKSLVFQEILQKYAIPWGIASFEITIDLGGGNKTSSDLDVIIRNARQIRRWLSWNTFVVVVSSRVDFLRAFARLSLSGRFLVWKSKVLVITRLEDESIKDLLTNYWTYSMMNSLFLNLERNLKGTKWSIYTGIPYSPRGKEMINIATWTAKRGLSLAANRSLFPEKYDNYYGSTINITALPFPPHWIVEEEQHPNGTITEMYKGTDAYLLQSIAHVLNFTYQNVVVNTWLECEERVSERVAFLSPVYYVILPNRMELHDYTFTYEFMSPAICALKPTVKPQWESLYYPLTNEVWGFTLCVTILVPVVFILGNRFGYACKFQPKVGDWAVSEMFIGTLLSQAPSSRLPEHNSIRVLVMAWLIFAFIIGAAYRGNLIASLTLSKSPPRAETIDEINKGFDTVLMPPHGNEFKKFFEMPGSAKTFQELARRMVIGTKPLPGLRAALTGKVAYMDGRRFAAHHIAQYFTNADGSTKLYMAREDVLAGMSAWAIPHDAPFQPQIDFLMMAAIEGGLYEKWNEDILSEARLESQRRQKKIAEEQTEALQEKQEKSAIDSSIQPFTLIHTQGPFMLLILGLLVSTLSFAGEILAHKIM